LKPKHLQDTGEKARSSKTKPRGLLYKLRTENRLAAVQTKDKENRSLEHHEKGKGISTSTAIAVVVQMNVDRVTEFTAELLGLFLGECTPRND
jgi:hypothetical protein